MKKLKIWFEAPTQLGLLTILLLLFAIAFAALTAKGDVRSNTIERIDYSISYLLRYAPTHPLRKSHMKRRELATQNELFARRHRVCPYLLTAMEYYESSFEISAEGSAGETGILQTHGTASFRCKQMGFDLKTQAGQVECGAWWLAGRIKQCGSVKRGLVAYACGKCKTVSHVVNWRVERRIKLAERLKAR